MRALCLTALPLTLLVACGGSNYGEADVTGAIGELGFGEEVSAYHGTSFIVIVNTEIDCLDMAWVTRNYFGSNEAQSDVVFGAVQFSFPVGTEPEPGTSTFDGTDDGPIDVWRLLNDNVPAGGMGTIDPDTAEEYNLTIDEASDEAVSGSFQTLFSDSNAEGTFTTTFCRNVR